MNQTAQNALFNAYQCPECGHEQFSPETVLIRECSKCGHDWNSHTQTREGFYIGQPVRSMYDKNGWISAVNESSGNVYMLGAGMEKINKSIDVIYEDNTRSIDLSEQIVLPWTQKYELKPSKTMAEMKVLVVQMVEHHQKEAITRENARIKSDQIRSEFEAVATEKMPPGAKAVIVAELHVNDSDIMTDYHGHTTKEVLILAWSTHTRDLFPEMRKAALNAPETEHLGPGKGCFTPRVMIGEDFHSNGSYYHKGCGSVWHSDLLPECKDFTTTGQAQAWIDKKGDPDPVEGKAWIDGKNAPYSIKFDDTLIPFYWKIEESKIEHREKYSFGAGYYLKDGHRDSSGWSINKIELYHGAKSVPVGRWCVPERVERSTPTTNTKPSAHGYTIEQHYHEKRGYDFFICVPLSRLERDEFTSERDRAKDNGGWYSRKWGQTPGGFAFKSEDQARSFTGPPDNEPPPPTPPAGLPERFRKMSDKLQSAIDNKRGDRLTNTPKRQKEAASARSEADKLERTQQALNALADLHEAGTVPEILAGLKSKKAVYDLLGEGFESVPNGWHQYSIGTGKPHESASPKALALWDILSGKDEKLQHKENLDRMTEALRFNKIPGYFPTPKPVVDLMLDYADITTGQSVLEPSAGSGAIVDGIEALDMDNLIVVYEINHSLCEILQAKGYDARPVDFTEQFNSFKFDRIVMNPPFENLQDITHVCLAYSFLKIGGRMVSIMSPGPFFRQDKKAVEFRNWFDSVGGEVIDLPEDSFKQSGTGTASKLVIIDRE
jgi:hypothetical protein